MPLENPEGFAGIHGPLLCFQGIERLHHLYPDISSADHLTKIRAIIVVCGCKYRHNTDKQPVAGLKN
jgi:hypothetical protein